MTDDNWSFSNGQVRLDLFHARQTGELSATLEPPQSAPEVPLARLFERDGDPDADWTARGLILHEANRAEVALQRLSGAIDRNAAALGRLTANDVSALYEAWLEASQSKTERQEVHRNVAAAERLWHEGNFQECARVLTEIEGDLSPAQLKRLELARRKA